MAERNSLKEYYVNLMKLYNNAVNILTAINQSMVTSSSEVTVTVADTDDATTTLRLPSFLYLENKVEQLDNKLSNLFSIPESGEAWFDNSSNMSKLNLIRSNTAPVTPAINSSLKGYSVDNNLLKDLVCPKLYLKVEISNLTDNIQEMFMKKIVFLNSDLYDAIKKMNISTYDDYKSALYNFTKGVDYEEYDSVLNLPLKTDLYISQFNIISVVNSWTDESSQKLCYTLDLNTIHYYNQEDSTIQFGLKAGDYVCLGNEYVKYKVKFVDTFKNQIIVEEEFGHINLTSIENNSEMVLQIYNNNYDSFHYVQVPLEENQYIAVFLGTIFNNVRSVLSDAILVDLSTIYMYDENNNYIKEKNQIVTCLDYYNKYCKNIGDLLASLSEVTYPQIGNCTSEQLQQLQNGNDIAELVTKTISPDDILKVVPINKHLIDDVTTQDIINLHAQKNEIDAQLLTVTDNISQVYNTLINTDFSQELYITQEQLQSQLQKYYTERTTLTKQFNSLVDAINQKNTDNTLSNSATKYRVRGVSDISVLETYLHNTVSDKYQIDIIELEVEYKYKSTTKDTTTVTVIDKNTFTEWNRLNNIDRQRHLEFDALGNVSIEYNKYDTTDNIIKWNQIDIPIKQGEDVVLRVRYKYNVGQPFINLYTPWSDEITMIFPAEYENNIEITSILQDNQDDIVSAKFSNKLINDGYQEHINNSLTVNSQKFYHMPENIYSGFNTSENNMLSLKDKLNAIDKDLNAYKVAIDRESNSKYEVYISMDKTNSKITSSSTNTIDIYNINHINDTFIKKEINLVIKNTGETPLRLYSIFPGQVDVPLIMSDIKWYNEEIGKYERVPLYVNDKIQAQVLGQCIYFRQYNPYTNESMYYHSIDQDNADIDSLSYRATDIENVDDEKNKISGNLVFQKDPKVYMKDNNSQLTLGYRNRSLLNSTLDYQNAYMTWGSFSSDSGGISYETSKICNVGAIIYKDIKPDSFYYVKPNADITKRYEDMYLGRYEDILGIDKTNENNYIQLDNTTSLSRFLAKNKTMYFHKTNDFIGAFLYVNLPSLDLITTTGGEKDYVEINVGKSLSIPLIFECYIPKSENQTQSKKEEELIRSIERTLAFDIRESLVRDPDHFIVKFVGHADNSLEGQTLQTIPNLTSLEDSVTNKIN